MIWKLLGWIEEIVGGVLFCAFIWAAIHYLPLLMLYPNN